MYVSAAFWQAMSWRRGAAAQVVEYMAGYHIQAVKSAVYNIVTASVMLEAPADGDTKQQTDTRL